MHFHDRTLHRRKKYLQALVCFSLAAASQSHAGTAYTVTNNSDAIPAAVGSLRYAIMQGNDVGGTGSTITFGAGFNSGGPITLAGSLPPIYLNITSINTNGFTVVINGLSTYSGLLFGPGTVCTVTNTTGTLVCQNTASIGGQGGGGFSPGGGGLGAGGGILCAPGSTVLISGNGISLTNCSATGGSGGAFASGNSGAGGGGGMAHAAGGASSGSGISSSGGGGGFGVNATGGNATVNSAAGGGGGMFFAGGSSAFTSGGGGGGDNSAGAAAVSNTTGGAGGSSLQGAGGTGGTSGNGSASTNNSTGGGGGGGTNTVAGAGNIVNLFFLGGRGGLGNLSPAYSAGGGGVFGGGGGGTGGAGSYFGGSGGGFSSSGTSLFGGGGGGCVGAGGNGGFGGGGGGTALSTGGTSIYGGGSGGVGGGGGGGAALGGAIFIGSTSTLILTSPFAVSGSSVTAGSAGTGGNGATAGQSHGTDIFITSSGTINFNFSSANSLTINSNISSDQGVGGASTSTGGVAMSGLGTLALGGTNSYTGFTSCSGGVVQVSKDVNLGSTSPLTGLQFNNGTLETTAAFTTSRPVTLNGTATVQTDTGVTTFSGNITGGSSSNTFFKTGSATLALSGVNTYSNLTNISAGTLSIQSTTAAFPSSSNLTISTAGATFDITLAGGNVTAGDLNGVSGSLITIDSHTLSFGTATAQTTFAGNISGTGGGITKQGAGISIFSGTNTYTGLTTVSAGTLQINATTSFPAAGNLTVAISGATFDISHAAGIVTAGDVNAILGSTISLGANTLVFGTGNSTNIFGNITGPGGGIVKQGSGEVVLSGNNTYTGLTAINAGDLAIGSGNGFPSGGNATIASGAAFDLSIGIASSVTAGDVTGASGSNIFLSTSSPLAYTFGTSTPLVTFAGNISGTVGSITKQGTGTVVFSGTNTYTGILTTVSAGSLQINATSAFPSGQNLTVSASGAKFDISQGNGNVVLGDLNGASGGLVAIDGFTLTFGTGTTLATFAGNISGTSGSIVKQGAGTMLLSGTNTYSGTTAFNAGTVQINSTNSLGSGNFSFNNSTLEFLTAYGTGTLPQGTNLAGSGTFQTDSSVLATLSGNITGAGALVKTGAGTLNLSGANTYTGITSFNGGTLQVSSASSLGSNNFSFNSGTLELLPAFGTGTLPQTIQLAAGGGAFQTDTGVIATLSGNITGPSGALTKSGTGTLILSGTNTYGGLSAVSAGSLQINATHAFPASGNLTISAGALFDISQVPSGTVTVGAVNASTSSFIALGANTLAFGIGTENLSSNISGAGGSLVKLGSDTTLLSGTNSYSGTTFFNAGTIQINATYNLGTSTLSFNTGTLEFLTSFSSSTLPQSTTLTAGGGTFQTDAGVIAAMSGNITGAGALTKTGTGTLAFSGVNSYSGLTTVSAGSLQINTTSSFPAASNLSIPAAGALFDISQATPNGIVTAGDVTGASGALIALGPNTFTFGTGTALTTFAGNISGAGGIAKQGTGISILSGTNTYSSLTTVSAGSLQINATSAFPSGGNLTVSASGAKFDISHGNGNVTVGNLNGVSGGLVAIDGFTFTFGTSTLLTTFAGNISGTSGSIVKQGNGTTLLSGTNSYTGTTSFNAGTLQINSTSSLGSGNFIFNGGGLEFITAFGANTLPQGATLTSSGSFVTDAGVNAALSGNMTGAGAMNKKGTGTLIFSGTNSYAGLSTIATGTLQINATYSFPPSGSLSIPTSGAKLDISNAGGTVTAGTVNTQFGSTISLGSNFFTFGTSGTSILSGNITGGAGGITVQAAGGIVLLGGTNTYSGLTTLSGGLLIINTDTSFPSGGNLFISGAGADFDITSSGSITAGDVNGVPGSLITLGSNFLTYGTSTPLTTFAGNISNSGGITKQGAGISVLSGTNTYSGLTTVSAGSLQINATSAFPSGGNLTISTSGLFDISQAGGTITAGDLNGSSGGQVNLGANTLAFGTATAQTTFAGNITGAGGIVKQGAGIALLSGINAYTGTTSFNAGTVQINATANLGSGSFSFNSGTLEFLTAFGTNTIAQNAALASSGGAFQTDTGVAATLSGNITGPTGTLTKTNSGTLILSGTNTYGPTLVSGGTLQINASPSFPTGGNLTISTSSGVFDYTHASGGATIGDLIGVSGSSANLGMNALTFGTSTPLATFAGNINTTGNMTKQGAGTAVLSGVNSLGPLATISGGSLQINALTAFPSGTSLNIPSSGAKFDMSNAGGSLTVGDLNGASGSLVALGANSMTFGLSTALTTFAGNISGTGSIVKQGAGTAVFSGSNAYGATTVSQGTLKITLSSSFPASGNLALSAPGAAFDMSTPGASITATDVASVSGSNLLIGPNTLTLGGPNSTTFGGDITGSSGAVTKQGIGTFTLASTSSNSYSGNTTVQAGTLAVNGTIALSPIIVNSGATLAGTGTVGNVTLSGTVTPGNSIGTLNTGSFTFQPGSSYDFEFTDTTNDLINASGTVFTNSGSTIVLSPQGISTPMLSYTLISAAGGVNTSGGLFNLVNPLTRYGFSLVYDPTDVRLVISAIPFADIVTKGNAGQAAICFDSLELLSPTPTIISVIGVLDHQTPSELYHSFNQMQPANFNNIAFAEENVAERVRQIFTDHFYEQRVVQCPERGRWRAWLAPFVEKSHQGGQGELKGYDELFGGFSTAIDYLTPKHWTLSAGFSLAASSLTVPHGMAQGDFKTYAGTFGIAWAETHWFLDTLFSYFYNTVDAKRQMHFVSSGGDLKFTAKHDESSDEYLGHFGIGYNFKTRYDTEKATILVYPFANVDYVYLNNSGYTEHGADGLDLKVDSKNYNLIRPEGGIGLNFTECLSDVNVQLDVKGSYVREIRTLGGNTVAYFNGVPCQMTLSGLKPENNLLCPTVRVRVYTNRHKGVISFTIGYHGEFGSRFSQNAGEAELKFSF